MSATPEGAEGTPEGLYAALAERRAALLSRKGPVPERKHPSFGYLEAFGARVREMRTSLGLTQLELGSLTDLTRASINNIENGRQNVSILGALHIAAALGCQPADLLPKVGGTE